jgi:2-polyprenyl-3-methyl-5-hydroxy-6-metoxy-1,4-benzoquinol methylase
MAYPTYGASDHYLGEKGEQYFGWQHRFGTVNGEINAHKVRHLIRPADTVVDFGCGGGDLLRALECSRRIGVEINPIARQRASELGVQCYADLAEVPDEVADVVISNHALEHVPCPIEALTQLKRKLKPGGILALSVPIDDWRTHKRYNPDDRNHHLYTWTVQLLGNLLCEAGFSVEPCDISVRTHAWPKYYPFLYAKLPLRWFNALCAIWAMLTRRGQLFAVAKRV